MPTVEELLRSKFNLKLIRRNEMKTAKLHTKRVMIKGIRKYQVLGWSGIAKRGELPTAYLNESPHFFIDSFGDLCLHANFEKLDRSYQNKLEMKKGVNPLYDKNTFQFILDVMRQSGERLTRINKDIKILSEQWEVGLVEHHEI
jgi:hypothetical protein